MAAVCDEMAKGQSIRSICKREGFPSEYAIRLWGQLPEYSSQYARAREARLDYWADEIVEIADDTTRDTISTDRGDFPNAEWINRSRLRVDSRKWIMSKLAPKKYGEKLEIAGDPEAPLMAMVIRREVRDAG